MTESALLDQAEQQLLGPGSFTLSKAESVMGSMMSKNVDYGELYFQHTVHEGWALEDGIVRDGSFNIDRGVGVRATSGEKSGFAYSDDIALSALQQAAGAAKSIASGGGKGGGLVVKAQTHHHLYTSENPLRSLPDADKIALLKEIDALARPKH